MENRNYREYYWKRLDNAAKGFAAISDTNNTNVYRLSVKLKDPIKPAALQAAMERTLSEIPSFNIKQRKGLFWYYFESNFARPIISEEKTFPCLRIDRWANNGFLFRTSYFGSKVNLEVFHALTDGTGALMFLKRLLYNYLSILYPDRKLSECAVFEPTCHPNEYDEDSFLKNYSRSQKKASHTAPAAYRLRGALLEKKVTRVITGVMPVGEVVARAKACGATVTEYLSAVLIRSIYLGSGARAKGGPPIVLCIPVNLRSFYPSHTLSNFFSYLNIGVEFSRELTFEEILEQVRAEFARQLRREEMELKLRYNVEAENNLAIRFLPLTLKKLGLRLIHRRGERGQSCALSNLGIVELPEDLRPFVERFDVLMSISSLKPLKAAVVSYNGRLTFTFTSALVSTDIQQYFFSYLSGEGISVELISNYI